MSDLEKNDFEKKERLLLFDGGCSTCSTLAEEVAGSVEGVMMPLPLADPRARELLDRAYPHGWAYVPHVVEVEGDRVQGHRGWAAYLRLGLWMGPRRTGRLFHLLGRRVAPAAGRRGFLRGAGASLAAFLFLAGRGGGAEGREDSALLSASIDADGEQNPEWFPAPPCSRCGKFCRSYLYGYCSGVRCSDGSGRLGKVYIFDAWRDGQYNDHCCSYCGYVSVLIGCAC